MTARPLSFRFSFGRMQQIDISAIGRHFMKFLAILDGDGNVVFTASGQTVQTTAVQVNSQAPTYLYAEQASKLEGDVKRRGGDNFAGKGAGR